MVVSPDEIKRVSLDHYLDVLKKNEPEDEAAELIERVHEVHTRMMECTDDDKLGLRGRYLTKLWRAIKRRVMTS